jgi:hypothetical protein
VEGRSVHSLIIHFNRAFVASSDGTSGQARKTLRKF